MEWDTGDKVFNKHTWLASAAQEEPHPKGIRKLVVDRPGTGEASNVERLAHHARERGCHAVVFARDSDGPIGRRHKHVLAVVRGLQERGRPAIAGGYAVRELEAWVLAVLGSTKSEALADPAAQLHSSDRRSRRGLERPEAPAAPRCARSRP